ncbi:hypothetical protein [Thermococcus sp. Bubb.Bath]|uniref:hypothetical protein n=1 Tax=Thermococcus sp. Bubb.Bath TaxID=1638242 RepID=UPI00143BDD35|nr:hypothetical protein [Thermococcus sp. Bubb.Bath]NJF24904.1 hypothetical protein [Thermococcus sp. Bubb.Bath]
MAMFDKGKQGLNWDYLRERHVEIISELKTLHEWDKVKSIVPEAENLNDYSILALQALASLTREFHTEKTNINERINALSEKLDDTRTEMRERDEALEKRVKTLEGSVEDTQRKLLFVEGIGNLIPRINELEEKLETGQAEMITRMEKRYSKLIEERVNELIERKLKEVEDELKASVLGVSVDLAKSLKDIQEKHEKLVVENYTLRNEVKSLRSSLLSKEKELEKLRAELTGCREMNRRIEELQKRVQEYEKRAGAPSPVEKDLMKLMGTRSAEEALEVIKRMKSEYVPKSKVSQLLSEMKRLNERVQELEEENKSLREKNEKLSKALKMLIGRSEESEEE